ncbi:MAG TPA: hypothetical protein VIV40_34030 [Kofleriaceae bacterium]
MNEAARPRTTRITLATIVLAAATISARHVSKLHERPSLAKSFEADVDDWTDEPGMTACGGVPFALEQPPLRRTGTGTPTR